MIANNTCSLFGSLESYYSCIYVVMEAKIIDLEKPRSTRDISSFRHQVLRGWFMQPLKWGYNRDFQRPGEAIVHHLVTRHLAMGNIHMQLSGQETMYQAAAAAMAVTTHVKLDELLYGSIAHSLSYTRLKAALRAAFKLAPIAFKYQ